jgi:uncharacterized membrane protein YcaP (DUF421 family)
MRAVMPFWPESWGEILLPQAPVLESVVRASAIYLFAFLLFRVVLRRESGGLGVSDLLVIILIAAATHTAMAGHVVSVFDGLVLVSTLVFWDWLLSFVAFRSPWLARVIRPRPVVIVRDGKVHWRALRRELLTRQELEEQLRLHGVKEVSEVEEARIESDGEISVIPRARGAATRGGKSRRFPDLHR